MASFIAVINKDKDSDYGVSFPDFPGCVTAGKTLQEAVVMANEALAGHISVMNEYGDYIPSIPMTLDQVSAYQAEHYNENNDESSINIYAAIEAPLPSKPVRVNVMLDSGLLQRIDRVAQNRSAFLAEAAIARLISGTIRDENDNPNAVTTRKLVRSKPDSATMASSLKKKNPVGKRHES